LSLSERAPYAPKDGPSQRVAAFLLCTDSTRVSTGDLVTECGITSDRASGILGTRLVRAAMRLRGWYRTTRKGQGLSGAGRLLIRVE
jgi:hypothetical protein